MTGNRFVCATLLALVTTLVFAGSVGHEFVYWDDNRNIFHNPHLEEGSLGEWSRFWTEPYAGMFIPVTYTVWAVVTRISPAVDSFPFSHDGVAPDPALYHAVNVIFHAAAAVFVFLLVLRLLPRTRPWVAALAAGFFALHPLQAEPVAWATGLKDVLSGTLSLASIFYYFAPVDATQRSRRWRYAASFAFFALALLAKPVAVVVPALIALLAVGLRDERIKPTLVRLTPLVILSCVAVLFSIQSQPLQALAFPIPDVPFWQRPLVALDAVAFYGFKTIIPLGLGIDYGRTPLSVLAYGPHLLLWLLPLAAAILALRHSDPVVRRRRLALLGFAVAAVLPVCGLISFAHQGISTVADRYAYLALAALALGVAGFLNTLSAHRFSQAAAAFAVILVFGALLTARQVTHWKDTEALFVRGLKVNPESVISHYNLAIAQAAGGRPEAAIAHYRKTIALAPEFPFPYNNLAKLHNERKEFAQSIPLLEKAIALTPGDPMPHINLGFAAASLGDYARATGSYRQALALRPGDARLHTELGYSLANSGDFAKAIEQFRAAIETDATLSPAYEGLGRCLMADGRTAEAVGAFERWSEIAPLDPKPRDMLARARETLAQDPPSKAAAINDERLDAP